MLPHLSYIVRNYHFTLNVIQTLAKNYYFVERYFFEQSILWLHVIWTWIRVIMELKPHGLLSLNILNSETVFEPRNDWKYVISELKLVSRLKLF